MNNSKILVIGDVMLDEYWFGNSDRISPEAPTPIINVVKKEYRIGGAGNVALNLFELGTNVQQLQSSVRNAVEIAKRLISNQFDTGINLFTGQELDISEADRKLVEEFLDLDISDLSRKDALVALDSLTEFVTNGSTGGMQFIVDNIIGKENAKTLKEEGVKSKPLMSLLTDTVPVIKKFALLRGWANNIATFPAMTELMFRGQEAANKFMNVSGLQTLFNNVADARTKISNIENEFYKIYNKKKPNGKSFSNA